MTEHSDVQHNFSNSSRCTVTGMPTVIYWYVALINITRHVCETIVAMEKKYILHAPSVCVCVCVCARVRACGLIY
jgi:hypothetical protein